MENINLAIKVAYGDLENAIKLHTMYYTIWTKYGALPERFNWKTQETEIAGYPLRPELIESTYLLYQVLLLRKS